MIDCEVVEISGEVGRASCARHTVASRHIHVHRVADGVFHLGACLHRGVAYRVRHCGPCLALVGRHVECEIGVDVGGVIEIDPATYNVFKNNLIELSTNNPELIRKGVVGMYDNFEVIMSNAIYKDASHKWCIVRSREAIAFVGQINEVESLRLQDKFSDGIRGLDTYGMKIIAQDELQAVKIPA